MKIKNIGDGLEKKPIAPIEDFQSVNSVGLGSSTENSKPDVGSSNDTAIKINSNNSIEETWESKWGEFQHKLKIGFYISMNIVFVVFSMRSLSTLNKYTYGLAIDNEDSRCNYILRSFTIYILDSVMFYYIAGMIANYVAYIQIVADKRLLRHFLYLIVLISLALFNGYMSTLIPNITNLINLWVVSLFSVCFLATTLVFWKLYASYIFPPKHAEFIKMVSWEIIMGIIALLAVTVLSYVVFICKNANPTLKDIQSKLDKLAKMNT
ncbi:hypothetical protein NECID01_2089 [Nematocida sp. AWRm77]|nr:hypothetical protein NECID01_2089 [Nematocida sp. AWRm77]